MELKRLGNGYSNRSIERFKGLCVSAMISKLTNILRLGQEPKQYTWQANLCCTNARLLQIQTRFVSMYCCNPRSGNLFNKRIEAWRESIDPASCKYVCLCMCLWVSLCGSSTMCMLVIVCVSVCVCVCVKERERERIFCACVHIYANSIKLYCFII